MKITKQQIKRIIKEEKRSLLKENFSVANDELAQAKAAIIRQDKYFSNLAADFQSQGNNWLVEETMNTVNQLRQASDLLDTVMANISTIQRNTEM